MNVPFLDVGFPKRDFAKAWETYKAQVLYTQPLSFPRFLHIIPWKSNRPLDKNQGTRNTRNTAGQEGDAYTLANPWLQMTQQDKIAPNWREKT